MGGFNKLMKTVVGSAGRVLGFAPAPQAPQTAIYQTGGSRAEQAAAARQAKQDALRRDELARQAEETRLKSAAASAAAEYKKKALAEAEARRKANVLSSGRASTILAGENPSGASRGKSLLGA